ncbi:disease resistance-like protein DSC1 [Prosopis cineraria]|uniref:disease resistance-like protein DSC1 n=1 Tax=Prosopis cineraria TaxID=364024 RepID=UPI00240FA657|nr:disease resistance-like protein DSC1 [Prosopis cineraria]
MENIKHRRLSKMKGLRILILCGVKFSGSLSVLSNNLRYLSWNKYPFNYLPSNFIPTYLGELIMPNSNMTQLWRDQEKDIPLLRSLNLCGSKDLKETHNFRLLPSLERLDLEGCTSLVQLHPSIAYLTRLKFLNLRDCTNLISIPNELFVKSSLEFLNLAGCSKFAQCLTFPEPHEVTLLVEAEIKSSPEVLCRAAWFDRAKRRKAEMEGASTSDRTHYKKWKAAAITEGIEQASTSSQFAFLELRRRMLVDEFYSKMRSILGDKSKECARSNMR